MPTLGNQTFNFQSPQLHNLSTRAVSQLQAQTKLLLIQMRNYRCADLLSRAGDTSDPAWEFWDDLYKLRCTYDVSGLL